MRFYTILFVMLLANCIANAQAADTVTYEEPAEDYEASPYPAISPREVLRKQGHESEPMEVRKFDDQVWRKLVEGKNYSNDEADNLPEAIRSIDTTEFRSSGESQKSRQRQNSDSKNSENPENSESSGMVIPIPSVIVYVLGIAIIGYILFIIFKNLSIGRSGETLPKAGVPASTIHVEDIKELEVDRLLADALAAGNHRLAIRIYFLGLLKSLDEDGLIAWKKDKTNNDYMAELVVKTQYFNEIRQVTIAYEQVWYGDHDLSVSTYETTIALFKGIIQKLKRSKAE